MLRREITSRSLPSIEGWTIVEGSWRTEAQRPWRPIWNNDSNSLDIKANGDTCDGQTYLLTFADVAQFEIIYPSREIRVLPFDEHVPVHTIGHLLVDQVWPRILAHDGALVLHASGVASSEGAILFVGPSGRGKSTLSASLHQRGLPLIGDDAVVIEEHGGDARCQAVYRSLRLYSDSIETLFDPSIEQSDVADYTDKRNIHLPSLDAADVRHAVRAIFFINPENSAGSARVSPVSPGAACMRLVEHNFWLDPTDMARTACKLTRASALAACVPAWQLDYRRDFSSLDDVHAAIFARLANPIDHKDHHSVAT
jgi:hypothetical protein